MNVFFTYQVTCESVYVSAIIKARPRGSLPVTLKTGAILDNHPFLFSSSSLSPTSPQPLDVLSCHIYMNVCMYLCEGSHPSSSPTTQLWAACIIFYKYIYVLSPLLPVVGLSFSPFSYISSSTKLSPSTLSISSRPIRLLSLPRYFFLSLLLFEK